jgi:hypothetical protein
MDSDGDDIEEQSNKLFETKKQQFYDTLTLFPENKELITFIMSDLVKLVTNRRRILGWNKFALVMNILKMFRTNYIIFDDLLRVSYSTNLCNIFLDSLSRKCNKIVSKSDAEKGEKYCKMHRPTINITELFLKDFFPSVLTNVIILYL